MGRRTAIFKVTFFLLTVQRVQMLALWLPKLAKALMFHGALPRDPLGSQA